MKRWLPLLLALQLLEWGCLTLSCENRDTHLFNSPDQKHTAAVFRHGCGTTAPEVTVVAVQRSDRWFDFNKQQNYVFMMQGKEPVRIEWVDNEHLSIRHPDDPGGIGRKEARWKEIGIVYLPQANPR